MMGNRNGALGIWLVVSLRLQARKKSKMWPSVKHDGSLEWGTLPGFSLRKKMEAGNN
jgi:hypothetical protein